MSPFVFKDFKEPYQSLFIEASAGTGKTYTIQLMIARLIAEGTPLKKILVVTYTEKAAGELKDRIRKKINEVLVNRKIDKGDIPLTDAQLNNFLKAAQDVDNAAIFTIHSFCQKALKEYAYDAGRPFDMSMVNDSAVDDLIDEYVRDVWTKDDEFKFLLDMADDASSFINELKKKLRKAVDMYKGGNADGCDIVKMEIGNFVWENDSVSAKIAHQLSENVCYKDLLLFKSFAKNIEALRQSGINSYTAEYSKKVNGEKTVVEAEFSLANLLGLIESWNSEIKNPFTPSKIGEKLVNVPQDQFGESLKYVFGRLGTLKNIKDNARDFCESESRQYDFFIKATREIFEAWQKRKADAKLQSFNDMILSVHKAIMEPQSLLKNRLRAQYTFAIIDEFQDTNQLQWDIFKTLFLKDGKVNVPDHSIVVVGDPKQSIYSFQGADINVYQSAVEEIGNGQLLERNYRSTQGIIDGCNALFQGNFFKPAEGAGNAIEFKDSLLPADSSQQKSAPQIDGTEQPSIWISEVAEPEEFAETAVSQIVEWCSYQGGSTKLQVFDKDSKKYRDVSFKDFAILARSRTEMEYFENALRKAGIPYSRYKENSLFKSHECSEWIALFNALNAPDFSYWNRKLLNEALITDFFALGKEGLERLHYVESDVFDNPENEHRKKINQWRSLALKHRYAEMLECIYRDSKIDERLMNVSKLQDLAKLRQIGNYAIDYLYNHKCSLEEVVRHLEGLARFEESADDEDGDLVEKGSDFDSIQVMTIHASKGLEFPIVISAAGFKHHYQDPIEPALYHKDGDIYIGFGSYARSLRRMEELEEWKRLFYVDFTRAGSILVLPQYKNWTETNSDGALTYPEYQFLQQAIQNFIAKYNKFLDSTTIKYYKVFPLIEEFDSREIVDKVKAILKIQKKKTAENKEPDTGTENDSLAQMSALQKQMFGASIVQYSYSSLAGRAESSISEADDSRTEKDGSSLTDENANIGTENYPRGSKVGDALHNILERTKFFNFGQAYATLDDALNNPSAELENTIEEEFKAQSLPYAAHKDDWQNITIRFIWNTLHAELPEIAGADIHREKTFKLVELPETDHRPEVQFGMNADAQDAPENNEALATLHRVCKGFIDLLFVREVDGQKRYSILDWKSDTLESYGADEIKAKVDEEYSVQRVLYSYCLIQWLKQFYGKKPDGNPMTEQDIFANHFGGIYYAFLRGTDGSTGKGIYAHTWKDFNALEKAYENVKGLMSKSQKDEV